MDRPASEPTHSMGPVGSSVLLMAALRAASAFAEEPAPPVPQQPVEAAAAQTAEQAKMTVISLCANAGLGAKTLDSATAVLQGGAAYVALDACADVHPFPSPGWNGFYAGGEANGRFSDQGWGVGAAEVELGYDFGRFGLDAGYGAYWDVLDGNRANTNVDGVPHTSLDLYLQPFAESSQLSPLSFECSLGSQWPQGTYFHPAYMDLHCGVGGTWGAVKVNSPVPRPDQPKAVAVVEGQGGQVGQVPNVVASVEPEVAKPVMSIPELPRMVQLEQLPALVEAQRAKLEQMVKNFYVSDPGVKAMRPSYLTQRETPHFLNPTYYKKVVVETEGAPQVVRYETMNPFEVTQLSAEEQAKLYLGNLAFQGSYTTQDGMAAEQVSEDDEETPDPDAPQRGISDTIGVSFNYSYDETIAFVTALDAYVASAREAGFSVDPAVLSEYVLLQRMLPLLKAEIDAEIRLNALRYKSYRLAQAEDQEISERIHLGNSDAATCAKAPACVAQSDVTRLSGELKNHLKPGAPAISAFRDYENILGAAENGGLLTVADYQNGVSACMGVGRVDMALEAAEQLVRREYSPQAVDQLSYLHANYGLIAIKHEDGGLANPVFDPTAGYAVEYANAQLEKSGEFNGYLPIGAYTFPDGTTFEVKPGGSNKKVR